MEAAMKAAFGRVLIFGLLVLFSTRVDAHDPSTPHHEWFSKQEMNPAARRRLGVPWKSCCDNGDVFKTRFRVGEDRSDQWQYLKDGEWKIIPPDVIKEEDTPDHLPVLFINRHTGVELCFFVPRGGL
jgi:hypothetical protein